MRHLALWPAIGIVDFDAMSRSLGSHQHYNFAIGREQSSASPGDRYGKHILIENEFGSLARTSRICHLLTVIRNTNKVMIRKEKEEKENRSDINGIRLNGNR